MSDFRALAEKTVVELFDMVKEKVAEIEKLKSENDELQKRINELERWNKNQYDLLEQQGSKLEKLTSLAMELEGIAKTLDVNEGRGSYYDSAYRIREALRDETQPTSTR